MQEIGLRQSEEEPEEAEQTDLDPGEDVANRFSIPRLRLPYRRELRHACVSSFVMVDHGEDDPDEGEKEGDGDEADIGADKGAIDSCLLLEHALCVRSGS